MLDVTYEATDDLPPGRLAAIEEDRGTVRFRLDKSASLADVVRQLGVEVDHLMSSSHWFQLWEDEIVSRDTPGRPLRVEYVLEALVPHGTGIAEDRGLVRVYIDPVLDTVAFAAAMTQGAKDFLAKGHWFQLFQGEIIDNGPEPKARV